MNWLRISLSFLSQMQERKRLKLWERKLFASDRKKRMRQETSRWIFAFYSGFPRYSLSLFSRAREWYVLQDFRCSRSGWIARSARFFVTHICIGLIYKLILTETLWEYKYDSYINQEINDTLILRTKQEEEKKKTRILFDNEKSYNKAYSIFDEFLLFSSPFF